VVAVGGDGWEAELWVAVMWEWRFFFKEMGPVRAQEWEPNMDVTGGRG